MLCDVIQRCLFPFPDWIWRATCSSVEEKARISDTNFTVACQAFINQRRKYLDDLKKANMKPGGPFV
jgi:hypothetical protein